MWRYWILTEKKPGIPQSGSRAMGAPSMGGEKITVPVKGPYYEDMEAFYGMLPGGVAVPFKEAKPRSKNDLALTMDNLLRFMKSCGIILNTD